MDCKLFEQTLDAWLDGELPAPGAEELRRHREGCPACAAEAAAGAALARLLDRDSPEPPPGLARRTMLAYGALYRPPGLVQWWRGLAPVMRWASCGLAVAGLLAGIMLGGLLPMGHESPMGASYAQLTSAGLGGLLP